MGHRMEIYLEEKNAARVIAISKSFGIDAKVIGRVEKATQKKVTIKSAQGVFEY